MNYSSIILKILKSLRGFIMSTASLFVLKGMGYKIAPSKEQSN